MRRIAFLLVLAAASHAFAEDVNRIRAWRGANEARILAELRELVAIPNVASDTPNIERNANAVSELLRKRGIEPRLLRVEGAPPVVFGEIRVPKAKETLILYAHNDGQPVDRAKWATDPWTPVLQNEPEPRLVARSASDDKAPIIAMLAAVDALRATKTPVGVNVKFFFEGEEEAGSPHLPEILAKYKDVVGDGFWLIADGPVHQSRRLQLYYGVRGMMGVELTAYGPLRPLHSGHYGNWAPNPIVTLTHLLDSMRDEEGKILIDGFYDDVRPLTATERAALAEIPPVEEQLKRELALGRTEGEVLVERLTQPALNVHGIRGGGVGETSARVISPEAVASIDFRLVPDQTLERVRARVEAHLRARGYHVVHETPDAETLRSHPRVVKADWGGGYPASRVAMDDPRAAAIEKRIEKAMGQQVVKLPTLGGSVPLYLFPSALGVPIVNHDNNQHGANENLRLQNLWDGIEVFAAILAGD
jgi:acetylornithine deacetylase/succinyl-diaminopimelate desuccinylase-like protein